MDMDRNSKDKTMVSEKNSVVNKNKDVAHEAFSHLLSSIPGGVVQFEISDINRIILITDKMLKIVGCTRNQFREKYDDDVYNVILKEDQQIMKSKLEDARMSKVGFEAECRIVTYGDAIKWVAVTIQILSSSENKLIAYAVVVDINNYKKSEKLLEEENDKYRKMLNLNSDIFFEYDTLNDSIAFNSSDSGFSLGRQTMSNFSRRLKKSRKIFGEDKESLINLRNLDDKAEVEFRFISVDGSCLWCQVRAICVVNEDNGSKNVIGWVNNIDKQKKEREYQLEKAKRDPLTRLYNSEFTERIISEFLRNEGKDKFHAMLIIDIDNFKSVNNSLGNIFGDAVLVNIADNLQKIFYKSDVVGRIGGDEFLVFVKNLTGITMLIQKLDEINEVIGNTYVGEEIDNHITSSIGISIFPDNGSNYNTLFKNADTALYYAKTLGKNRYEFYDDAHADNIPDNELEFYNNYRVETIKKQAYTSFNREITTFAFDIMARTKDVNSAINLILDKVGKQFDATYVSILERAEKKASMTYGWSRSGGMKKRENMTFMLDEAFVAKYQTNFDEHGINAINDAETLDEDSELKYILDDRSIKSMLQCAIYENGVIEGCVDIVDCQKAREWTRDEMDSLVTITKVISSYLLKMRTSQKMEERLNEVKNFDALTGLPTLYKFKNDVRELLVDNPKKKYVIVNTDFYKFKYVNDTFGYEVGDQILKAYAEYITKSEMKTIVNCRVASDNFIAILEFKSEQDVINMVSMMSAEFCMSQKEKMFNLNLKMCSGACVVESNYGDIMVPIDNANIARKYAKENSLDLCYFFNSDMREKIKTEFEITNSMEKALAYNEFKVYLQPKVCLSNGSLAGAEALVRWVRPDKSIMPPDKFIPLFEKNGFVVNLDFFVYEEVCKMIRDWLDAGMKPVPISVNVSRVHLYDEGFVDDFVELINRYNVPNEYIELELTESIFLDNTEVAISTMRQFRSMGFKVSIDDFGAGYSSLNLLKEMTSDVLKLDKGFFGKGELQKEEQIIVSSIVNMAKQLNMKVLSEGVETSSQSAFLKNIDCDLAQGYLFAKPMPRENFEVIMSNNLQFGV